MAVPGFVWLTRTHLVHPRDFEDHFIAPCSLIDAGHSLNPQRPHEPSANRAWNLQFIIIIMVRIWYLYLNKIHNPCVLW